MKKSYILAGSGVAAVGIIIAIIAVIGLNSGETLDASSGDIIGLEGTDTIEKQIHEIQSTDPDDIMMKDHIKQLVQLTIDQYDGDLSSITTIEFGEHYSYVLSENLDEILIHPNSKVIGTEPVGVTHANISLEIIKETLKTQGEIWIDYVYLNPATGDDENKRSLLVLHEGYVFGSGYYNPTN